MNTALKLYAFGDNVWLCICFQLCHTCLVWLTSVFAFLVHALCHVLLLQQYSKQLEETMEKFAQGEIKILICTNIVESGLDIQNANTIIVQEVQQFGLAQLYQVLLFLLSLNIVYVSWYQNILSENLSILNEKF